MNEDEPLIVGPHPAQQALQAVEMAVLGAAGAGVRSIVISNPLIYGVGLGLHRESVQLPIMVRQAQASGVSSYLGRGINRWGNVYGRALIHRRDALERSNYASSPASRRSIIMIMA